MFRQISTLVLGVLLFGCNTSEIVRRAEVIDKIEKNKKVWQDSDIIDYTYTYAVTPTDCPTADPKPAMIITVEDGVVVAARFQHLDTEISITNVPTIDDVFDTMMRLAKADFREYSNTHNSLNALPNFDVTLGYPTRFYVDKSKAECDATSYRITDFH